MPALIAPPPIRPDDRVHEIAARHPEALAVLERFGLHVCCGGDVPLAVAAAPRTIGAFASRSGQCGPTVPGVGAFLERP